MPDFETELPPPVAAWFVEMHLKATPGDTSLPTVIKFQVEGTQYKVIIQRQEKELKF